MLTMAKVIEPIAHLTLRILHRCNSTSASVPKPKKPIDPEKLKQAQRVKKLHKMNKDMFGELLESSKEKSKRVKKEAKNSTKKLVAGSTLNIPARDDDYYLNPILDPTAGIEENEFQNHEPPMKISPFDDAVEINRTSKTPRFFPKGEKIKISPSQFPSLPENHSNSSSSASLVYRKEAEINWMLKTTSGMTKVFKGNFYNDPSSLAAAKASATQSQSQSKSSHKDHNNNEESKSRGAKSSTSSPGQFRRADAAVNTTNQSISEFSDEIRPRSEAIVIKRDKIGNTSDHAINEDEDRVVLEEELKFEESFSSPVLQHPVRLLRKEDFNIDEAIHDDDDDLPETKSFSQEKSKKNDQSISINTTTNNNGQEKSHNQSKEYESYEADKVLQPNVYNQGLNPSIIISPVPIPYFNPDRAEDVGAAFLQRNLQDPNLDQSSSSSYSNPCTETNSKSNQKIISIPFPRFGRFNTTTNKSHDDGEDKDAIIPQSSALQLQLPSVSKILNKTMPKEQALALERWQAKMILQMGEEGFRLFKENMLNNGKMLHSNIESFLRGTPMSEILVEESIHGHWNSLSNILPVVQDVLVLESRVVHPTLKYCGIVDCVAVYRNKLVVIDWKTSKKQKPVVSMTYDTPIQIAAYIGAINYDPNYSLKITEGLIVIAYEDGKTGHTFQLKPEDVAKYWTKWTQRLKTFYALNETENSN